jgi:DNA-binding NarL/FixJ family response regulator
MMGRITRTVTACPERAAHDRAFAQAREQLGDHAFRTAASIGESMTHDEVMRLIETVLVSAETPRTHSPVAPGPPASLHFTPREREVLRLLVDGHSNTAIGELLFISGRTAQTHVTNILAKLGVASRTEAAARAVRDGLV